MPAEPDTRPDSFPHDDLRQFAYRNHNRQWREFLYCYPVISRRSGGLSIGVNLNPNKVCNFDCVYCQVDRGAAPAVRKVDLAKLKTELERLLELAGDGLLFREAPFDCLPPERRCVRDIAFSGDGEPTTYPRFDQAVRIAAAAKQACGLHDAKLVLLTDACYLTRPNVRAALRVLDENNGEIWAKLDAGTQQYYELINRPNFPLAHVLENILDAARVRPVVIQSLWMRVRGQPPPAAEVQAFCDRLREMIAAGGRFKLVQVYTIARRTAEPWVAALTNAELSAIARTVSATVSIPVETYSGANE